MCEPLQGVTSAIITWDILSDPMTLTAKYVFSFFSKSNCFPNTSIKDESHKSFEMEQHAALGETINKKINVHCSFFFNLQPVRREEVK